MIKRLILTLICFNTLNSYSQNFNELKNVDIFKLDAKELGAYANRLNRAPECKVYVENDSLKITKYSFSNIDPQMSYPPNLRNQAGWLQTEGKVVSLRVFNGWIVGIDAGEWGGDLFWYSIDGKTVDSLNYKISQLKVFGKKIIGLNFGLFDDGFIAEIFFKNNKWHVKTIYKSNGCPCAFTMDSNYNIYLITTNELIRIDKNMQVYNLINKRVFWSQAYPNSMELYKGSIYIGMRGGVLKVTETKGVVKKEWFEEMGSGPITLENEDIGS